MAIIPGSKYSGQTDTDAGYPFGKARNVTTPGDGTGTPLEEAWVNDLWGLLQSLIQRTSVIPSGNADEYGESQYLTAMREMFGMNVYSSILGIRSINSAELTDGTLVFLASIPDETMAVYQVKSGTVTDDGSRSIVFTDDAARYASLISAEYRPQWVGTILALASTESGRWLYRNNSYSATAPTAAADFLFPLGAVLSSIIVENTGSEDLAGLCFIADDAPATASLDGADYQLTPRLTVPAGSVREFPVIDGGPDVASDMAIGFFLHEVSGASTTVRIRFVFRTLHEDAGDSMSTAQRRGDALAPVEAAGVVDLIERRVDSEYYPAAPLVSRNSNGNRLSPGDLYLPEENNVMRYTESPQDTTFYSLISTSASFGSTGGPGVIRVPTGDGDVIYLRRLIDLSAETRLLADISSYAPLSAGTRYILSFYVKKVGPGETMIGLRRLGSTPASENGHNQRIIGRSLRRVWTVVEAVNGYQVAFCEDPTLDFGSNTARYPHWLTAMLGAALGEDDDIYVGGFQIEPNTSVGPGITYGGIAILGDEQMAGVDTYPAFSAAIRSAGNSDDMRSKQISRWIESELNTWAFNRAIAGDTLVDMYARFSTDIDSISDENFDYVMIQGGANDIIENFDAGDSAATVLGKLQTAIGDLDTAVYALTGDVQPVYLTISPHPGIYGERETVRKQYNEWLLSTYPLVVDINVVLESSDAESILRQDGYTTDGYNLGPAGKKAVGKYIAKQPFWAFYQPTAYQAVVGTTLPAPTKIRLGGTISSGSLPVYLLVSDASPEGVHVGPPGSICFARTGSIYRKASGTGNTGWVAL